MSSDLHRTVEFSPPPSIVVQTPDASSHMAPRTTRTAAAWFSICLAALLLVILIVFMLQNTRTVEISFLWLHGSVPLALGLLVASVGTAVATMIVGVARITQLRRQSRRDHRVTA
jgi:uncharacterized integral membrane protein